MKGWSLFGGSLFLGRFFIFNAMIPPKPKWVVLVCVNPRPLVLLINSRVTRLYQSDPELLNCQILLEPKDQPFLVHDSYLDCAIAFEIDQERVEQELLADMTKIQTQLSKEVLDLIIEKVADSPRMPPRHQGWIITDISSR